MLWTWKFCLLQGKKNIRKKYNWSVGPHSGPSSDLTDWTDPHRQESSSRLTYTDDPLSTSSSYRTLKPGHGQHVRVVLQSTKDNSGISRTEEAGEIYLNDWRNKSLGRNCFRAHTGPLRPTSPGWEAGREQGQAATRSHLGPAPSLSPRLASNHGRSLALDVWSNKMN